MVEGAPNVEMRVFLRDQNPDLMDQYLNRGIFRSIPVFVFFDQDMKEVARFIERPPKITEYMEQKQLELRRQLRAQHGAGVAADPRRRRSARFSDERRAFPRGERPSRSPGRPAVVFGDRVLTYAELDREAGRVAAGLARRRAPAGRAGVPPPREPARSSSSRTTAARSSA